MLAELRARDPSAARRMFPLVYDELKRIARAQRRTWSDAESLNTTGLARGQRRGTVRRDVDPHAAATLVVLSQQGIWGTGKYSQDPALMSQAGEALCAYLEMLRPTSRDAGAGA